MSMTAVVNLNVPIGITLNEAVVTGTVTLAGSYATNGVQLDLSQVCPISSSVPNRVELWSSGTQVNPMVVDNYRYLPGTSAANGVVQIGVAGAEMAATAFATTTPTNSTGYVLNFRAWFPKFI